MSAVPCYSREIKCLQRHAICHDSDRQSTWR
jgi:hypothetical protein